MEIGGRGEKKGVNGSMVEEEEKIRGGGGGRKNKQSKKSKGLSLSSQHIFFFI